METVKSPLTTNGEFKDPVSRTDMAGRMTERMEVLAFVLDDLSRIPDAYRVEGED